MTRMANPIPGILIWTQADPLGCVGDKDGDARGFHQGTRALTAVRAHAAGYMTVTSPLLPTPKNPLLQPPDGPYLSHSVSIERFKLIPGASRFSRAFAEFSAQNLPARVHEVLICQQLGDQLIGHVARDSTELVYLSPRHGAVAEHKKKAKPEGQTCRLVTNKV